ncbi:MULTISPECIES: hypothetical protein [unclassified Bacillus (in: firmicutes)]|nr:MULTISPECIES: hypothetical protein [unclassified Bacillus (in: firmicutes)]
MIQVAFYPALTGSKILTSKFSESKEVRGDQLPVKARLMRAD